MLSGFTGEQTVLYCIWLPLSRTFPGLPSKPSEADSMGLSEKLPPRLRSLAAKRGFVPLGNFELVTRTGFEPMLTA